MIINHIYNIKSIKNKPNTNVRPPTPIINVQFCQECCKTETNKSRISN